MHRSVIVAVLVALSGFLLLRGIPVDAFAEESVSEKGPSDALELSCINGNDERVLIVVPKGQGCELHYNKGGTSQVVARSLYGTKVCEEVRFKIRKNLEASGFNCA